MLLISFCPKCMRRDFFLPLGHRLLSIQGGTDPRSTHRPARSLHLASTMARTKDCHVLPIQALGNISSAQLPFLQGYSLDFFRETCKGLAFLPFFSVASELDHMVWVPQDKPMIVALFQFFCEKKLRWSLLWTVIWICPPKTCVLKPYYVMVLGSDGIRKWGLER